jgi:hypothetical protein
MFKFLERINVFGKKVYQGQLQYDKYVLANATFLGIFLPFEKVFKGCVFKLGPFFK